MAELCARYDVAVISDEIHMDMVWGEHRHTPWNEVARGKWALLTSGSKSFNIPALTGAYGLIGDEESRNGYLSALKGRDGLSSPSVLALTAHMPPISRGAVAGCPAGLSGRESAVYRAGIKQRFSETELAAAGGDLSGLD
jgi:cystathionine beta-lyase